MTLWDGWLGDLPRVQIVDEKSGQTLVLDLAEGPVLFDWAGTR